MKQTSRHVVSQGFVRIFRQRTDMPFKASNTLCIETTWRDLDRLQPAYEQAAQKEQDLARQYSFAWNPRHGYVTSRPKVCGPAIRIGALFHLEGLHLIGDLPPVRAALEALRLDAEPLSGDGFNSAGHLFRISNAAMLGLRDVDLVERVRRSFLDLVKQELAARKALVRELPRHFEDAITRSLAILKSARLLSEWEFLDLLSPLRLAAQMEFLDDFTAKEADTLISERLDLEDDGEVRSPDEEDARDRRDAKLADRVNARFATVRLNDKAMDELFP